jgi:hypothetical protein
VATREAPVHQAVTDQIVANTERDTLIVLRNSETPREGAAVADVAHLAFGGPWSLRMLVGATWRWDVVAGQAQGLINEVVSCRERVGTMREVRVIVVNGPAGWSNPLEGVEGRQRSAAVRSCALPVTTSLEIIDDAIIDF